MPKESCIDHPRGDNLAVLRQHFVDMLGGDHCAAVVLAYFEYATNGELARFARQGETGVPWVSATMASIYEETTRLYSIRTLQERIVWLVNWGFLCEAQDCIGKVKRYLLDVEFTNSAIAKNAVFTPGSSIGKIADLYSESRSAKTVSKLPMCIGKIADEEALVSSYVLKKEEVLVEENENSPLCGLSNQLQNQLQNQPPDVPRPAIRPTLDRSGIHPIDDDAEEPASASRVKRNWKRPKPERPHGNSDRLRQLREAAHSGASAGVATLLTPTRTVDTPQSAGGAVIDFPARWNELVPVAPVDRDLLAPNPKAYREPAFATRFDEICGKAAALIAAGADLQFGFLLSTDRATEQYRWQQLLAGQLDWMKPKDKKPSTAKTAALAAANTRQLVEEMRLVSQRKANEAGARKQAEASDQAD